MDQSHEPRKDGVTRWNRLLKPMAALLHLIGVTPNQLTVTGAALCATAAALIHIDYMFWAGVCFAAGSLMDVLDGTLARYGNRTSRFGAFFDGTLDRVSEGLVFVALANHYAGETTPLHVGVIVVVMMNIMIISYIRAKAASLQVQCTVGLVTRLERGVILSVGLMLLVPLVSVYLLFFLTTLTILQRILYMVHVLKDDE